MPIQRGLDTFWEAKKDAGTENNPAEGVTLESWREAFYQRSTADASTGKRQQFHRARKALVDHGKLVLRDNTYFLARARSVTGVT